MSRTPVSLENLPKNRADGIIVHTLFGGQSPSYKYSARLHNALADALRPCVFGSFAFLPMSKAIISPSVLASDFGQLSAECERMIKGGADWLHMGM